MDSPLFCVDGGNSEGNFLLMICVELSMMGDSWYLSGIMQVKDKGEDTMSMEQQRTSTNNLYYDLVSVLYHALEGGQTYATYIQDAQQAGDQQLAQFFQQVQQQNNMLANQAQQLISQRMTQQTQQSNQTNYR